MEKVKRLKTLEEFQWSKKIKTPKQMEAYGDVKLPGLVRTHVYNLGYFIDEYENHYSLQINNVDYNSKDFAKLEEKLWDWYKVEYCTPTEIQGDLKNRLLDKVNELQYLTKQLEELHKMDARFMVADD